MTWKILSLDYIPDQGTVLVIVLAMIERPLSTCEQECIKIRKTCTRKANWEEAKPVGWKKDEKDERLDEYFGTLRTPWLVMNKLTYLETLYCTCFYIYVKTTYKYLDLSECIEHSEGDGGSEQEIRQGKGEYEDVSDIIIIIKQDILRRSSHKHTSSFGHWSVTPNPSPSKSPEVFFWSFINNKTLVLEHNHLSETNLARK